MYLNDGRRSEIWDKEGLTTEQSLKLLDGDPIDPPVGPILLLKRTPGDLPDLVTAPASWVVSERLRQVLESCGARLQIIPAKIERARQPFWLVHPLDKVKAVDERKSRILRFPSGNYRRIQRLVLRPLPADTPALFRLEEYPPVALVSAQLRRVMEDACESPGRFISPDKYGHR
jgi:hypothetical protein